MSSELPAQLSHMNIHPTKEHESDNILISLSFRGDVTNEPIIAQLIKKYNLNVSILYGSIDYIQDISFGRLLIMISGHLEDLTDALTHLNALPITSEVIGYVSVITNLLLKSLAETLYMLSISAFIAAATGIP